MICPDFLRHGDTVAVCCPAGKLTKCIDSAVQLLESWGLKVILGATTKSAHFYFSGNDIQRAEEFQMFIDDPNIKAIFAARGGYGSVRIIDSLSFDKFCEVPKWIVGFSDITVFHSHLYANFQMQTLHAQMPLNVSDASKESLESLRKALFGELTSYEWDSEKQPNRPGRVEGNLIGGNLSVLTALENSNSAMDFKDQILFIEDVGEAHYALDRMLYQLLRSGKLTHLKGLVAGAFSNLRDSSENFGQSVEEIIAEKVKDFDYPVAYNFPAGHIENNKALLFGRKIILNVENISAKITYNFKHII